jgi:hypothetical protein
MRLVQVAPGRRLSILAAMLGERDYVMRLVKQLADFIARALKLAGSAKPEEALATLREACSSALGMEYEVLSMLDVMSAIELLGEPSRALAFIRLVEAMGDVDARGAEPVRALTRYQHALELTQELLARRGDLAEAAELATRLRTKTA